MFDVEPETKLNDSQLRRLHMAMKDCHSLDIEFRMIAAVEKFLRVYNQHRVIGKVLLTV